MSASSAIVDAMTGPGGAAEGAIEVRGLCKAYGAKVAVDNLDLTVTAGEVFALLGPNGAGKTTTVEILEGYRARDAGTVRVLGVDPGGGATAWRARVGIVLQGTGEFDELKVEEVVRLFAGYYPNPDDPDAVIERVGLAEKRHAPTRTLSGGQKRRLDVALGVIGRPELLFLDEPTTGFDPEARREFWVLIKNLAHVGTTIMLTTHYLHEAEELADRVGVINHGRLIAIGPPGELGGRGQQPTRVSWLGPNGPQSEQTFTPTQLVMQLAQTLGPEVPGLTVSRPSLEDVYLTMIDESLAGRPA
jgi:ABC-2 type transport system ATP-binding protein